MDFCWAWMEVGGQPHYWRAEKEIMAATAQAAQSGHLGRLTQRIRSRNARVGVVGLGYVGLPLAVEYARAGFNVTGIDLHQRKIDLINGGKSYIQDVRTSEVVELVAGRKCQLLPISV